MILIRCVDFRRSSSGHSVEPGAWAAETDRLLAGMAGRLPRVETRRRAAPFVCGLLADLPRKNCWSIADHSGDGDPHGMQHLLARASWDAGGLRDDLRDYVIASAQILLLLDTAPARAEPKALRNWLRPVAARLTCRPRRV